MTENFRRSDLGESGILCSEPGDEIAEIVDRARALTDMWTDERRAADLATELLGNEHEPRHTDGRVKRASTTSTKAAR